MPSDYEHQRKFSYYEEFPNNGLGGGVAPGKRTLTDRLPARSESIQRKPARPIGMASQGVSAAVQAMTRIDHPAANAALGFVPDDTSMLDMPVQGKGALDGPEVHEVANRGIANSGSPLPHLDRIQAAFGAHDVSGVRAHVGGAAAEASAMIGASAYAIGNDVAFAREPDLHLAAHEAAHVVQQRAGVQLAGGLGRTGDAYEQHADAVADTVVRGKSAEPLLDQHVGDGRHAAQRDPGGTLLGGLAVQRRLTDEERATANREASSDLTLEQLAHRIAYLSATSYLKRKDREALRNQGFDVDNIRAHSGWGDLQFWTFPASTSAERRVTPVIAFRGTESLSDLSEDFTAAGVGMGQFTMNHARIQDAIRRIGAGRGVVATGHSLGGALAQIAACFYPDLVVRVVTFQAPGISNEVLARMRAHVAAGNAAPTAIHHRVDGCIVDDAGDGFVAGEVVVWGNWTEPYHAHTAFPLLSAEPSPEPWMTAPPQAVDPSIGHISVRGTTAGGGPARPTGGIAEAARSHPTITGAVVGGRAGAPLWGGPGAIVGGITARVASADARRRDAYARIWTHEILPHAEAVDRLSLGDWITRRCAEEGIDHLARRMALNYRYLFPELAASDVVLRSMSGGGGPADEVMFVEEVATRVSLDHRQRERVRRYWAMIEARRHCPTMALSRRREGTGRARR